MELTIEQALQQGIAAHKQGKLQDAERLYRAILQSQPANPNANHNLGVMAVLVDKTDAALPLFKTALKSNPNIEQFWLSYIDALIKTEKFDDAKRIIGQAKTQGVAEEKLNVLKSKLTPNVQVDEHKLAMQSKQLSFSKKYNKLSKKKKITKSTKQNLKVNNPSQQQLNILLDYYQNRQFDNAEKLAISITNEFPKHKFAWKVLGAVFGRTGRKSQAVDANLTAVALAPQDAEAHSNLGVALKELGRLDDALASYKQAIALKPDYAEAHCNLGVALKELGRLDDALASYKQAIALKPDYAAAHSNLGVTLKELGRLDDSINYLKQSIGLNSDGVHARMSLNSAVNLAVPSWHFPMMNDEQRNKAYADALELSVRDGDFVLDIGTGSGLLSLMAAASGAEMVTTCEMSKTIAEAATQIIESNGYKEKIRVINKKSTNLVIGEDLPQQADLIISEVFSSELVGEGVRATVLDANKRLLKKGGRTIPQSGKIRIALIDNSPEIFNETSVASVQGFDLSLFNSISPKKLTSKLRDKPVLLSNPTDAFHINLTDTEGTVGQEKIIKLRVKQDGLCVGLIQWIWIHLYGDIEYENKPGECDSHWHTPIYLFDKPVIAKKGDVIEIKAVLGDDYVWFWKKP